MVEGSRVGIVGGSIAGCAAAIALGRAGCRVTVHERHRTGLADRGFGVGMPVRLREELIAAGYLGDGLPAHRCAERLWVLRDGRSGLGRVLWRQPFVAALTNWGLLWRALRDRVPDAVWRAVTVTRVRPDRTGAALRTDGAAPGGGDSEWYDMVVGADGYRSMVRRLVDPVARPVYAGYGVWRGTFPEGRLAGSVAGELERGMVTVCFPAGHAVFYLIPDLTGGRRVNWAVYTAMPGQLHFPDAAPPRPGTLGGTVLGFLDRLLAEHFPPRWAEVVRGTGPEELLVQPVYDTMVARYTAGPLLLAGDAGAVGRPHTAGGAAKALADALALERTCRAGRDTAGGAPGGAAGWPGALAGYGAQRRAAGNALVRLGRRIGRAQVERTPPWEAMTPHHFATWMEGQHTTYG